MDYLDHAKELRHRMILFAGYILLTIGIVTSTLILVYRAYGFGLAKNGTVTQDGLAYFSSHPNPADIYVNGVKNTSTNARLSLSGGIYQIKLTRSGYYDWQRTIEVGGGDVRHFDYPFLVPKDVTTKKLAAFSGTPGLTTQSPDHRWLLVQNPGTGTSFSIYDLKNPTKPADQLTLPDSVLTKATGGEAWQVGEWADDNQHLVLQHSYDGRTEYILVDRTAADQSQNLNTLLATAPTKLTLLNHKYDQYYVYDGASANLQTASLGNPTLTSVVRQALAYRTYGNSTILYATDSGAPSGQVLVKLAIGSHLYNLRNLPAGANYLLELTNYSGKLYVAVSASNQSKVYIYKDPVGQLQTNPGHALVPAQVLHVDQPSYLSFSPTAQFVVAENATQFGVYDIENQLGYSFVATQPIDSPATHASWMDGNRLTYTTQGKLVIFDYDNTNQHLLTAASATYLPAFSADYKYVYCLAGTTAGQELIQTALLAPKDL